MKPNTLANKYLYVIAYIAIAIVLCKIGFSLNLRTYKDDDVYFVNALSEMSFGEFLHMRYMTWSGRIIIEAIMVKTINIHYIWRIMIPACLLLLCHSVHRIASDKCRFSPIYSLLIMTLFFFMPSRTLNEGALWITGFYNYLLPVSFGFYSISVIHRYSDASKLQKLLSIMALPIACSNEQMGIIMIAFIVYSFVTTRSANAYRIIFTMISIVSFAILMLAPGNKLRFIGESRRIPEFADYSILDKVGLGIDRFSSMINSHNTLLLLTSVLLVLLYFKNNKGNRHLFGIASAILVLVFAISKEVKLIPSQFMSPGDWASLAFYVRYMLSLVFYVSLIYLSFLVFRDKHENIFLFLIIMAPATVLMMGFSPTVYASADRVLFIFESMLLIICFSCVKKII